MIQAALSPAVAPPKEQWERYVRVIVTNEHTAFYRRRGGGWETEPFLVCFAEGLMVANALTALRCVVVIDDQRHKRERKS